MGEECVLCYRTILYRSVLSVKMLFAAISDFHRIQNFRTGLCLRTPLSIRSINHNIVSFRSEPYKCIVSSAGRAVVSLDVRRRFSADGRQFFVDYSIRIVNHVIRSLMQYLYKCFVSSGGSAANPHNEGLGIDSPLSTILFLLCLNHILLLFFELTNSTIRRIKLYK